MDTFTFKPLVNPQGEVSFRSLEAQFGDGYRQIAGDGINTKMQTWPLQFRGQKSYITQIRDFLDSHAHTPFEWVMQPFNETLVVIAKKYSVRVITYDLLDLSVTFEEYAKP